MRLWHGVYRLQTEEEMKATCRRGLCAVLGIVLGLSPLGNLLASAQTNPNEQSSGTSVGNLRPPSPQEPVHSIAEDMQPINTLLLNHDKISFRVTLLTNGVRTVTTSTDAALVPVIRLHSREMHARMEQGNVIRETDPIFRELFRHHSEITFRSTLVPGGIQETETSRNPQVVLLLHAHSRVVASFVRGGMAGARNITPLPPGYRP
jgi:hypothetical protein